MSGIAGKDKKYVIILIPGISDIPSQQLNGETPLQAAHTPHLDQISSNGRIGLVETTGGANEGGSDRALFSLLGYDPSQHPIRRGPLEAAGLGIEMDPEDLALRLNFVSTFNNLLVDHNAGQISDSEAASLIKMLNARFGTADLRFCSGLGYRNLLLLKGGKSLDLKTVPPQEALHQPVVDFYPYGKDAGLLADLMDQAHAELVNHDINAVRVDLGENPADRIWLWGEGVDFTLPAFDSYFDLEGCIISAVPLLKGIAHKIGFHHVAVPGATGYVDTDYEAKACAGLRALAENDLVIVHVGAVNEVCHQGDPEAKVRAIEAVDHRLVGPILEGIEKFAPWRLMVASDHMSPAEDPRPLKWPVPVAFCGHEVTAVREYPFTEQSANKSDLFIERGPELMEFFLNIRRT